MYLFCYVFLILCLSVLSQSALSTSIKSKDAQDRKSPYQSYAKLLNNHVIVNERRVDAMRKLSKQQDLYVSGPGKDNEDNNVYLVVRDDAYDRLYRSGKSVTKRPFKKNGSLKAMKYEYRQSRLLCQKACIDALVQLCNDYECGPGIKRSYPEYCKKCCEKHIED